MESYDKFFNKSFLESIYMQDDVVTIKKIHGDPLLFKFIDIGEKDYILNNINETISVDDNNFAEIIYLSKYLGDYNITKFGDKLTFENKNKVRVNSIHQTGETNWEEHLNPTLKSGWQKSLSRDDWKEWYYSMCEILPWWGAYTIER